MHGYNTISASRSETRGDTTGTSRGTTLTSAGVANTKGSWVSLGSVTTFDYEYIMVCATRSSLAMDIVIDIGIQISGGTFAIASDLRVASRKASATNAMIVGIPVHIPSGSQLQSRCAASSGGFNVDVSIVGFSGVPGQTPGYSRCIALSTATVSRGISVDAGATPNTKGAWSSMTSSLTFPIEALMLSFGHNADIARVTAPFLFDIGCGTATVFVKVANLLVVADVTTDTPYPNMSPLIPFDANAGDRIEVRCQSTATIAGDRAIDVMAYGLVK